MYDLLLSSPWISKQEYIVHQSLQAIITKISAREMEHFLRQRRKQQDYQLFYMAVLVITNKQ